MATSDRGWTEEDGRELRLLTKRIGTARFRLRHAGTGRAGAPAKKLTAAEKAEAKKAIEAMTVERRALQDRRKASRTADPGTIADDFESGVAAS